MGNNHHDKITLYMKESSFLDTILRRPHYPFIKDNSLYFPNKKEHLNEIFSRLNFIQNKKNWISFFSLFSTLILFLPLFIFLFKYFSFKVLFIALTYTFFIKNIHCTAWLHRYASHHAFKFRNQLFKFLFRHSTILVIGEEIYAVSHLVHHAKSEQAGDPYNALGGWAYCFYAEITHNPIALNLSEKDYLKVANFISHTGIRINTYEEYQKWGTISHPLFIIRDYLLNWSFWFLSLYFLTGSLAYPLAIFGMCGLWGLSIRNFNFKGHGSGHNKHQAGRDFYQNDLSVNIPLAGYVAGEWHNHHHLYPTSARNDFMPHQPDFTFYVIYFLYKLGIVTSFIDKKKDFIHNYYLPYVNLKERGQHEILNS
jgi:fatty-acid desaturase